MERDFPLIFHAPANRRIEGGDGFLAPVLRPEEPTHVAPGEGIGRIQLHCFPVGIERFLGLAGGLLPSGQIAPALGIRRIEFARRAQGFQGGVGLSGVPLRGAQFAEDGPVAGIEGSRGAEGLYGLRVFLLQEQDRAQLLPRADIASVPFRCLPREIEGGIQLAELGGLLGLVHQIQHGGRFRLGAAHGDGKEADGERQAPCVFHGFHI